MSSLLGDELTMAQPSLWCFSLAPCVLNHLLESANTPKEVSTSVLNGYSLGFKSCCLWKGGDMKL